MARNPIWNYHDTAFKSVGAFVVLDKDGEHVANIKTLYKRGNSNRVWAYVHAIGAPIVRGFCDGGGYDMTTEAIHNAARKLVIELDDGDSPMLRRAAEFASVLRVLPDNGHVIPRLLEERGYKVLNVF